MCPFVFLLLGLLTFVSGHPPSGHDTGCDVAVLRLEKMITDVTSRVNYLENQRELDAMAITNLRQDLEKVKTENHQLKTELDNMVSTMRDRQPANPDGGGDIQYHNTGSSNLQSSTFGSTMDKQPSINGTDKDTWTSTPPEPGENEVFKEETVHVEDTNRRKQHGRIRRDDRQLPQTPSHDLTNRVGLGETVAFFSTLTHQLFNIAVGQIIQFDNVITNNGGHFDEQTGVFTCGAEGTYVFSWSLYTGANHWIYSELVKNGKPFAYSKTGNSYTNAEGSSTAVINLLPGDRVWTRVQGREPGTSIIQTVTTFSGFKI